MAKRKPVDAAKLFFYLSVGLMLAAIALWVLMAIRRDAGEASDGMSWLESANSYAYLETSARQISISSD